MASWADYQESISRTAGKQLFFVGGAPRSGTTWLQEILNAHPDISCKGEGLFWKTLAVPLETLMTERRKALEEKNAGLFRHTGGYPLPAAAETEHLLGTAILAALARQCGDAPVKAIGEKTPENVFFFPRLRELFPQARFIAIARDPRDVLTSAWYFFRNPKPGEDAAAAKIAFLRSAIPSIANGARVTLDFHERHPDQSAIVTYEDLVTEPLPVVSRIFRLLGVPDDEAVAAACLAATSFQVATGGRRPGDEARGSFHRKGVAGDWRTTLTADMNALLLEELGWMYPKFGWRP